MSQVSKLDILNNENLDTKEMVPLKLLVFKNTYGFKFVVSCVQDYPLLNENACLPEWIYIK